MALHRSQARLLFRVFRWQLTALAVVVVAGLGFFFWLLYRGHGKVGFTDWSADATAIPGQKPSPLGSSKSYTKEDEGRPVAPPMAIPPKSDLEGGSSLPVLPGVAEVDSPPATDDPARARLLNTPWPVEGQRYRARHKKGFGGCWGELLLGADRLVFTCADDPRKNLVLTVGQITGVDDDGVAVSGDKFHFGVQSVAGKKQVHELFGEWLTRTRNSR